MKSKFTLVLGASDNHDRTSYRALHQLQSNGHPIYAIGKREAQVGQTLIHTSLIGLDQPVDTCTMYLNAQNQKEWYNEILRIKPNRIIFNPGSENPELEQLAEMNGIETERACTLVLLATNKY